MFSALGTTPVAADENIIETQRDVRQELRVCEGQTDEQRTVQRAVAARATRTVLGLLCCPHSADPGYPPASHLEPAGSLGGAGAQGGAGTRGESEAEKPDLQGPLESEFKREAREEPGKDTRPR